MPVETDRQFTVDMQVMGPIGAHLLQKKRLKGHKLWWYVIRRDQWPVWYYNQETRRWVGSFRSSASRYRTREKAEKVVVLLAATEPDLIGNLDVIERD